MSKLLMITGLGSAKDLASGKKGAFYNTLEEFHKYWDRIDIISPKTKNHKLKTINLFGNVYVHISPWPLMFYPFWFIRKGLEIYKEHKFNLITVQEFPPFYNGIAARLLWNKIHVPYILEIHHIPGYPRAGNLKEKIYSVAIRLFARWDSARAKAVRVVNKKQTPEFLITAGVPENKILYIPSAYIDLGIFRPMNLEKKYDLIFVGRLEMNKGFDLFLEAARESGARALVVGSGPLLKELKTKNYKLKTDIYFWGWAKDSGEVAELMNQSKLLVMPSYNEGGPRVVLEAMACGVPVLATPVGIVPDIIKDRTSGKIIDWNVQDIVAKVRELLSNQDEYDKYRAAGLEISRHFEKNAAIKNYAEELKKLI